MLKTITSMEFYEKESTNAQEITLPKYKLEQIADLENICEVALNKLGKTLVMGDEFCSNVNYKSIKVTKHIQLLLSPALHLIRILH